MATVSVTLTKGLKIEEEVHLEAVLREATAGDLIEATADSERLMLTPEGYQLVPSPTMVGTNVLCRQIVRIGTHNGPLTVGELGKLSAGDLKLLQQKAEQLEAGAFAGVTGLGRDDKAPA